MFGQGLRSDHPYSASDQLVATHFIGIGVTTVKTDRFGHQPAELKLTCPKKDVDCRTVGPSVWAMKISAAGGRGALLCSRCLCIESVRAFLVLATLASLFGIN